MNLLSLNALSGWGQALAAAAATAAVATLVVMYFLKLKRVRREVPSTFLWKKSVQDMRANSPFQRLRKNLLLFLQLLILLAALFALARPALNSGARTGATYILLVDNSASMNSRDVSGGRLEAARTAAKAIVSDMGPQDAMMILSFAARPQVVKTLTDDKKALFAAINSIEGTEESTEIVQPLELASSLAQTVSSPKIVVISDGAFGAAESAALGAPLEFIGVGARCDNLGVTAMDVRRNLEDPTVGEIFAKVSNPSPDPKSTTVSLRIDGKLIDAQKIEVPAAGSHAAVFKVTLDVERLAKVSIDASDDLESDNYAWAVLEPPKNVQVVVLGQASPFLKRALFAAGTFRVSQVAAGSVPVTGEDETPVFVCEGTAPPTLSAGAYLIFNAVAAGGDFLNEGTAQTPLVIDVDETHPVTSYLDLDDLYIVDALKIKFPPETKVLVNGDHGPLVALSYSGGARVITVAFDPLKSRWPLRISYPMFIANAVNFLASSAEGRTGRMIRTGEVLVLSGDEGDENLTVTDPRGIRTVLPLETHQPTAYGDTRTSGVYTVESQGGSLRYVASLTSPLESNTTPGTMLKVGATTVSRELAPEKKNREIWRELLAFAFVVLVVEWYIYNRRVYI